MDAVPSDLTVLSLGAGVQSTTLALLSADVGPRPDVAIFADTGWEPPAVYENVRWLRERLPFPVVTVTAGDLRADLLAGRNSTGQPFTSVPLFVERPGGRASITRRQCTREYKVAPIIREVRRRLGLAPGARAPAGTRVEQWIGISTDEIARAKTTIAGTPPYIALRYPLIDRDMSRRDCLRWLAEHYPEHQPVRSACIGCPYHTDDEWHRMATDEPALYADAAAVDAEIHVGGAPGLDGTAGLHRSLIPLGDIDWATRPRQLDFFGECDGLCYT